jgi:hypothetical protein
MTARRLLTEWLSAAQLAQFDAEGHFEVIGCPSGKKYRIHQGASMDVHGIDAEGESAGVTFRTPFIWRAETSC